MDHRWDDATMQDRRSRAEQDRFKTSGIERDPDVERRDRLCVAERARSVNRSPWEIGEDWYDQRDTYTRNAEIDTSGYGCGPSIHPEEGSYAYPRPFNLSENEVRASGASIYEKEAWPWLVYKDPESDPYFSHLHEHERHGSFWQHLSSLFAKAVHLGRRPSIEQRPDERIIADVSDALFHQRDLDASDIEVSCKRGEVTLEGTVVDRESRRAARDVARSVSGVHTVRNRLKVRRDAGGANAALVMSALAPA